MSASLLRLIELRGTHVDGSGLAQAVVTDHLGVVGGVLLLGIGGGLVDGAILVGPGALDAPQAVDLRLVVVVVVGLDQTTHILLLVEGSLVVLGWWWRWWGWVGEGWWVRWWNERIGIAVGWVWVGWVQGIAWSARIRPRTVSMSITMAMTMSMFVSTSLPEIWFLGGCSG